MGEEIGPWQKDPPSPPQLTPQRLAMAEYFHQHDPYHHHVVIHNGMWFDDILRPKSKYSGVSVRQVDGGGSVSLGGPPAEPLEDWLILVRR